MQFTAGNCSSSGTTRKSTTRGLGLITHLRTSNPGIKGKFKNLFKADTWRIRETSALGNLFIKGKTGLGVQSGQSYYKDADK